MSRFVEVSPVPPQTTQQQVEEVFNQYILNKHILIGRKVLLQFQSEGDVQVLEFAFGDKVKELGNASIKILPQDFKWPTKEEKQRTEKEALQPEKQDMVMLQKENQRVQKQFKRAKQEAKNIVQNDDNDQKPYVSKDHSNRFNSTKPVAQTIGINNENFKPHDNRIDPIRLTPFTIAGAIAWIVYSAFL